MVPARHPGASAAMSQVSNGMRRQSKADDKRQMTRGRHGFEAARQACSAGSLWCATPTRQIVVGNKHPRQVIGAKLHGRRDGAGEPVDRQVLPQTSTMAGVLFMLSNNCCCNTYWSM